MSIGAKLLLLIGAIFIFLKAFPTAPPPPHSCFDPDYPNEAGCIQSDANKSAIESFQRGLTISENRARTGKWVDAPKGSQ